MSFCSGAFELETNINIPDFNISDLLVEGDGEVDDLKLINQEYTCSSFYYDYISKYYPKANVIRQKFIKMTPEKLAEALNDIVHVFTKEPWFYFQNTPKGFKLIHYWEYVLDQCGILHDFLKKAKVDLKSKKIFIPQGYALWDYSSSLAGQNNKLTNQGLLDYLKKNHKSVYTSFFALSFDYQVKFFNEGILLKDLKQVNKYFAEIEYILEKLRDTPKESDYYEATKTCKNLVGILKKKLGIDKLDNDKRGIDQSNNESSNYFKEFTELNDVI